jgi:flagellar export protein FliJ
MLLKLRRRPEDRARQAFAAARRELEVVASRIRRLKQARVAHDAAAREALLAGSGRVALSGYRQVLREINLELVEQAKRLATVSAELELRRSELAEARKQRKAMEALRDRLAGQVASRRARGEIKALDELHAARAAAAGRMAVSVGIGANA